MYHENNSTKNGHNMFKAAQLLAHYFEISLSIWTLSLTDLISIS